MSSIQACCVCLVWRSNPMSCRLNRTGKSEPWNTELHLVRRTDTTRPVVSPSLPLLKKTAHCANCQRSHRAPSGSRTIFTCTIVRHVVFVHVSGGRNDHNRHGHSKETMEIFVQNVNKLARHLPGDKIDGISAGRCPKPRKYGTKRRLAREAKKQVQATGSAC